LFGVLFILKEMVFTMTSSVCGFFSNEFQIIKSFAHNAEDDVLEKTDTIQKQIFAGLENGKAYVLSAAHWVKSHPSKALDGVLAASLWMGLVGSFASICILLASVLMAGLLGVPIGTSCLVTSLVFVVFFISFALVGYCEYKK
jgi:hypothetical protein